MVKTILPDSPRPRTGRTKPARPPQMSVAAKAYLRDLAAMLAGKRTAAPPTVRPTTFGRWLGDERFRRHLRSLLSAARSGGEIVLAAAASRAAHRLAASIDDPDALPAAHGKACVEVIRLSRQVRPRRPRADAPPDAAPEAPHPDLPAADVAALLAALGE